MIARLKGKVIEKNPTSLVVDVGGIGYLVMVPISTSSAITDEFVELFIQTEVKEDAIQLYGFQKREERDLFVILRGIHGIGPQTALAILSSMSIEEFFKAVKEQNPKRFLKIPKVGKKSAERILLELKEKDLPFDTLSTGEFGKTSYKDDTLFDAVNALESLGYKYQDALKVIENLRKLHPEYKVEDLIKVALQSLSP